MPQDDVQAMGEASGLDLVDQAGDPRNVSTPISRAVGHRAFLTHRLRRATANTTIAAVRSVVRPIIAQRHPLPQMEARDGFDWTDTCHGGTPDLGWVVQALIQRHAFRKGRKSHKTRKRTPVALLEFSVGLPEMLGRPRSLKGQGTGRPCALPPVEQKRRP